MTAGAAIVHVARSTSTDDTANVHAMLLRLVQEVLGGSGGPRGEGGTGLADGSAGTIGMVGTDCSATHGFRLSHACPRCGSSDHGRPLVHLVPTAPDLASRGSCASPARISPAHVSLARASSGGVAVLAVCVEHAVGVDTELADDATLARVTDPEFRAFAGHDETKDSGSTPRTAGDAGTVGDGTAEALLRDWVRTEAVLKARGTGLSTDPAPLRWRRLGGAARRVTSGPPARLVDVDLGRVGGVPLLTAVAVAADVPVRVLRHELT